MTEIPEHLLKRSKAAKSGKSGGGDAAPETGSATVAATEASAPVAAAPAANLPNLDPPPKPPKPVAPYVAAAMARKRIPMWVLPVIAALPVWAYSFAGTMQQPATEDALFVESAQLYGSCSGCHGGTGGGGVGYQLSAGEVMQTFPDPIDQMAHVARGSAEILDQSYGAPRADGSARVAGARGKGPMPAQLATLNQLELELVVFHERAVLSGEETTSAAYQEWITNMRERISARDSEPIDLDLLLACANPDWTPGATGTGSADPATKPCPGPPAEAAGAQQAAAG